MQRKNFKTSAKKKYYIVKKGKNPGVYYNWPDCQKQVQGFPGAVYKGFVTREEAEAWYGKPVKEASHAPAVAPKKKSPTLGNRKSSTRPTSTPWMTASFPIMAFPWPFPCPKSSPSTPTAPAW